MVESSLLEVHPRIHSHYVGFLEALPYEKLTFPKRVVRKDSYFLVDNLYIVAPLTETETRPSVSVPKVILPIIAIPAYLNVDEDLLSQTPLELLKVLCSGQPVNSVAGNTALGNSVLEGYTWKSLRLKSADMELVEQALNRIDYVKTYDLPSFDKWVRGTRGLTFTKLKVLEIYRRIKDSPVAEVEYAFHMGLGPTKFYCHVFIAATDDSMHPITVGFSPDGEEPRTDVARDTVDTFFPDGDAYELYKFIANPNDFVSKLFSNINIHFYRLKKYVKVRKEVPDELSPNF